MARGMAWVLVGLVCAAVGCAEAGDPGGAEPLLILAAASTSEAASELAGLYAERTGRRVTVTTGGSNALASQILAGAPGDVYLSANVAWADAVVESGLAVESRALLSNRLVIVVPRGNPAEVTGPGDLVSGRVRRNALAGEHVPAGMYAEQALKRAGVFVRLTGEQRVARGQDVRLTLGYVETGEAEAGVVYATDARASDRVEVVYTFGAEEHDPIVYPLVLLRSAEDAEAARGLYEFFGTAEALAVFERHGFTPLPAAWDAREPTTP